MARYATTCFSGDALRWHIKLDKEIKNDWSLLEDALIDKYPRVNKERPLDETTANSASTTASIPTPASAPPLPSQAPPLVFDPSEKVYHVALTRGSRTLYLLPTSTSEGLYADGSTRDAIRVKIEPGANNLGALRVVGPSLQYLARMVAQSWNYRLGYSDSVQPVWQITGNGVLHVRGMYNSAVTFYVKESIQIYDDGGVYFRIAHEVVLSKEDARRGEGYDMKLMEVKYSTLQDATGE
ncbi:hypothetical protein FRB99_003757 [Tulasnella sp. 403]|nr:hypothetical protein FRB99_003757 [Tulasnella sp. 403]